MTKLIIALIISSVSPCQKSLNLLRKIGIFTASFEESIQSKALGNSVINGMIWFKHNRARIEIYQPDTEYVFIEDTLIKTLNLHDSTLIIQRKMGKTEFFYNLVEKNQANRIETAGDICIAWFYPDIESIDSIKFLFTRKSIPLEAVLFQANVVVKVKLKNFKILKNLPDSLFTVPKVPGIHIIKF